MGDLPKGDASVASTHHNMLVEVLGRSVIIVIRKKEWVHLKPRTQCLYITIDYMHILQLVKHLNFLSPVHLWQRNRSFTAMDGALTDLWPDYQTKKWQELLV